MNNARHSSDPTTYNSPELVVSRIIEKAARQRDRRLIIKLTITGFGAGLLAGSALVYAIFPYV
ncbi:MAG: hypothetical protein JKY49_08205 [Cohaesibacteraceae bacterium]|nr:hypothetical protein [Cohaesibacteraceae bacterium]